MNVPQLPTLAHYTPEDVRELVFKLDSYIRYANRLEAYIVQMLAVIEAAGVKIPGLEEQSSATQEGEQQEDNFGQHPNGDEGRQAPETGHRNRHAESRKETEVVAHE